MGHNLRAFVSRPKTLRAIRDRFPGAKIVELDAGFAMIPATDALLDAIDAPQRPMIVRLLTDLSAHGPIAFVETDYFGGVGSQAGTACVNGEVVTDGRVGEPINEALRAIGVVCAPGGDDEFDTVGLRQHRSMDDFEEPEA